MTGIAILIPTLGRPSLRDTLASLINQTEDEDLVAVYCDDRLRYDWVQVQVSAARVAPARGRWRALTNWSDTPLGACGHAGRNELLRLLDGLGWQGWVWSLDDDDEATPEALAAIRALPDDASWAVYRMRGGVGSHFPNITIPAMGEHVVPGNVGTPMIVWKAGPERYGVSANESIGAPGAPAGGFGYFGDYELSQELLARRGDPLWRPEVLAIIRPVAAPDRITA